ncbi:hypothetical protein LF887_04295 [Chryseobacterium sp. MEBOG06]|uniref:hypothetical protein n=1 Tax=Chryseobacterium sp. MEBOG06 TaxID=2879938 RepID=UPI001F3C30F1|nr:hypothetical protein [Chryseobacterium sp. MEBOG06]UKB84861.1 hypothetical protein LF887_04295 [Chryseobacterium sp. MEBOG06]
MDAMSEKYSSWSPYNYAINNPVMVIDPDGNDAMFASGEAAQFAFKMYVATMSTGTGTSGENIFTGFGSNLFDDHFNQFGEFLYTDNKNTNNIIIDFQNPITGSFNTAPWLSVELKDYIFNKDNAFVLANIANHYAKDAGINLNNLKGNSMSVGIADYHFDAGKMVGTFSRFNGGEYNPDALMQANKESKTVSLMVGNGKPHPYYNDKNNMISALSHEGGKISHLTVNPNNINLSKLDLAKEHITIYEHQISSPLFKKTTAGFQQLMKKIILMINGIITLTNRNRFNIYVCLLIFLFISCKKSMLKNDNVVCSFQNLICDYTKDSIRIKNVETFLLFGNPTNDTLKVSLKDIQAKYRHIYERDTLKINFEALTIISIPPHDSLGLPCMSIIEKNFGKGNKVFEKGFSIVNVNSQKEISHAPGYRLKQINDFQLYKKWGRKHNNMTL